LFYLRKDLRLSDPGEWMQSELGDEAIVATKRFVCRPNTFQRNVSSARGDDEDPSFISTW
jgi:hypothetical protein